LRCGHWKQKETKREARAEGGLRVKSFQQRVQINRKIKKSFLIKQ